MRPSVGPALSVAHGGSQEPGLSRRVIETLGGGARMTDPLGPVKDRLILAVLPEIPFSGWTNKALAGAAVGLGMDRSMAERAFPGGPVAAVLHFADLADRKLED